MMQGLPKTTLWNIAVDIAVGSNEHIVADGHIAHYCCIDAHPHLVAEMRNAFTLASVLASDNKPFVQVAPITNLSRMIDRDVEGMTEV